MGNRTVIDLYLSPSCTSCRKARAWLQSHKVPFVEHNILTQPMTTNDLRHILTKTENGTEDIISTRSKVFQKLAVDVDNLTINELLDLVTEFPNLLRRQLLLTQNTYKLALTRMKFVHFCHVNIVEQKC